MTGREMIKAIMEKNGVTNAMLAHRLNITQATVWERLDSTKGRDIPLSTFCTMINALNCDVVVVPAFAGKDIPGAMTVTVDERGKVTHGGWKKGVKRNPAKQDRNAE